MTDIPDGPVADFVAGTNRHDLDAVVGAFAPDATVTDDGSTHVGHARIRAWADENQVGPRIVLTPTAYAEDGTGARLRALASGDFPGSPLPFDFHVEIASGRISALRITLAD